MSLNLLQQCISSIGAPRLPITWNSSEQQQSKSQLGSLPVDVLTSVFASKAMDKKTLAACSVACKKFYSVARPVLERMHRDLCDPPPYQRAKESLLLYLTGKPPEKEYCSKAYKLSFTAVSLRKDRTFLGFISKNRNYSWLFQIPVQVEPSPMSVELEGIAKGLQKIASDVDKSFHELRGYGKIAGDFKSEVEMYKKCWKELQVNLERVTFEATLAKARWEFFYAEALLRYSRQVVAEIILKY